jgi:predicted house-cleaning noncanonical NTP pyrophosphatase (MazG superfamily)
MSHLNNEKKESYAVVIETTPIPELVLNNDQTREIFKHASEDFYENICGKTLEQAWDYLEDFGNNTPTPLQIEIAHDLNQIKEQFYSTNGKSEVYKQFIEVFKKHGVDQIQPYKRLCEVFENLI